MQRQTRIAIASCIAITLHAAGFAWLSRRDAPAPPPERRSGDTEPVAAPGQATEPEAVTPVAVELVAAPGRGAGGGAARGAGMASGARRRGPPGGLTIVAEQRDDAPLLPGEPSGSLGATPEADPAVPGPPARLAPPQARARGRGPGPLRDYSEWPVRPPRWLRGQRILLHLSIGADGTVTGIRVLESLTADWDRRALQYAWTFRFAPARDDRGRPQPSAYRWQFVIR
jgi:hypothetical protein